MYSFISDNFTSPSLRVVYSHYGLNVRLTAVYAYDFDKGGNAFAKENPDILGYLRQSIIDALIEEIQEYLKIECGEEA